MYGVERRKGNVKGEPSARSDVSRSLSQEDEKKTKRELLDELVALRQRIGDLEAFEAERKAIASELKGTRQRLQYLLAVSPAIIYSTKASGDFACTFVSENSGRSWATRRKK